MMQIFHEIKDSFGLISAISPVFAYVTLSVSHVRSLPFLCGMFLALFFLFTRKKKRSLRTWLFLCIFVSGLGMVLLSGQNPALPAFLPPLLLGGGSAGLFLLLPSHTAVRQSPSPGLFLGLSWSGIFLAALPLRILITQNHTPVHCLLLMAAGFLLLKPSQTVFLTPPERRIKSRSAAASAIFVLCLTLCSAGSFSLWTSAAHSASAEFIFSQDSLLSWVVLAVGPLLAAIFTENRGIYPGCILSIFLLETALVCFAFPPLPAAVPAARILLLLAAGTLPVILPVLALYTCGCSGYLYSLRQLCLWIPPGLFFASAFWSEDFVHTHNPQENAAFFILLLLFAFFSIFFAWKRRFVILKNDIL